MKRRAKKGTICDYDSQIFLF
uniref:Uncharacterized protein n=1 Tax=Arundo donax TaxID=35708 RepID=A0A0A9SVM8_ARUDO